MKKFENTEWKTASGQIVLVKDLTNRHVNNILHHLLNYNYRAAMSIEEKVKIHKMIVDFTLEKQRRADIKLKKKLEKENGGPKESKKPKKRRATRVVK